MNWIILYRVLLGLLASGLTIFSTPASAQDNILNHWEIVSSLIAHKFESPQSEHYTSEVLESPLLKHYSTFCGDPRTTDPKGFSQAFGYYQTASLCNDNDALNYKATSTWFKIVGWIHLAHWQYYLPAVNHDLACVIKKMSFTKNSPTKLCLDFLNFAQFADQTSLKLNHLMNVLEILQWQQDSIAKERSPLTVDKKENAVH